MLPVRRGDGLVVERSQNLAKRLDLTLPGNPGQHFLANHPQQNGSSLAHELVPLIHQYSLAVVQPLGRTPKGE